jgi:hypothetical protein
MLDPGDLLEISGEIGLLLCEPELPMRRSAYRMKYSGSGPHFYCLIWLLVGNAGGLFVTGECVITSDPCSDLVLEIVSAGKCGTANTCSVV